MKERLFRFKEFSVRHARSAMKVGVDGVLIGAWVDSNGERLLDIGTGCGLIALMLAQKNDLAFIKGVDIDADSVDEARENVTMSPWKERVNIELCSFEELCGEENKASYDLIVSNPPFYDAGVKCPSTPRERSRHQSELSPQVLIRESRSLLKPGGRLAFIAPAEKAESMLAVASESEMVPRRICYVRDSAASPEKRVMMEFIYSNRRDMPQPEVSHLVMFDATGQPTFEYRELCGPFYLRF